MGEVRGQTRALVENLDQAALDWAGSGSENAIGTLLYHIALVELSWLFLDILERPLPDADFPFPMASGGRLTPVYGVPLSEHLARLERSRATFLEAFRTISLEDWSRPRSPGDTDYSVTPAWAVFHLVEHEAGHAAQISGMKKRMKAALG